MKSIESESRSIPTISRTERLSTFAETVPMRVEYPATGVLAYASVTADHESYDHDYDDEPHYAAQDKKEITFTDALSLMFGRFYDVFESMALTFVSLSLMSIFHQSVFITTSATAWIAGLLAVPAVLGMMARSFSDTLELAHFVPASIRNFLHLGIIGAALFSAATYLTPGVIGGSLPLFATAAAGLGLTGAIAPYALIVAPFVLGYQWRWVAQKLNWFWHN